MVPAVEPLSPEGEDLVQAVRDTEAPYPVLVTGQSAGLVDLNDSLFDRLPLALGLIAVITAVLLFLMFGSVVIPAKAIVLNLLSLSATFGAMVWIFQDGHLSGRARLHRHRRAGGGHADPDVLRRLRADHGLRGVPAVRIKEEHDHGADNVTSVAVGLERTGGSSRRPRC